MLRTLSPSAEAVAKALAGRDHTRLQPAGAYAANALGFSEQVPAKAMFLTDGASPMALDLCSGRIRILVSGFAFHEYAGSVTSAGRKRPCELATVRKWIIRHAVRLPAKKGEPRAVVLRSMAK